MVLDDCQLPEHDFVLLESLTRLVKARAGPSTLIGESNLELTVSHTLRIIM